MAEAVEIFISDHALYRYVERVHPGITLEEAWHEIMAHERALKASAQMGGCCVRLATGQRLIMKGCDVVTVTPAMPKMLHSPQRCGFGLDFSANRRWSQRRRDDFNNGAYRNGYMD